MMDRGAANSWRAGNSCYARFTVGGGIVFPLSVSVGLALELLLSDVLIGVGDSVLLLDGTSRGGGNEGEDNGSEFHC